MADSRWQSVVSRDPNAEGKFVYCVKTTKIFCRPTCKARLARRANVEFYLTPAEAQAAGYRACKRCQPLLASYTPEADKIKKVCEILDNLPENAPVPVLGELSKEAGLTKHHFHRLFKRETGLTPRQYALASRAGDQKSETTDSTAITPVLSTYDNFQTPLITDYDYALFQDNDHPLIFDLGKDLSSELEAFVIYYTVLAVTSGVLLVAFQNKEICKLELGTNELELLHSLEATFPPTYYLHSVIDLASDEDAAAFRRQMEEIVQMLESQSWNVSDVYDPVADVAITM